MSAASESERRIELLGQMIPWACVIAENEPELDWMLKAVIAADLCERVGAREMATEIVRILFRELVTAMRERDIELPASAYEFLN